MTFKIAIPSYGRPRTVCQKTLATLQRQLIDPARVTVFVADRTEAAAYREELPGVVSIVVAQPGIRAARNFIQQFYAEGTRLLSIDDDVSSVYYKSGEQGREEIPDLNEFVSEAFDRMAAVGATLAGVHPVDNPFFLRNTVTTDLRFVIGTFNLTITSKEPWAQLEVDEKEDFEQTLIRFIRDGAVLRYNGVGLVTRGRTEPGGLQTLGADERRRRNEEAAHILAARYPDLAKVFYRKNGLPELRLKSPRS